MSALRQEAEANKGRQTEDSQSIAFQNSGHNVRVKISVLL